jgi:hypothetical protein
MRAGSGNAETVDVDIGWLGAGDAGAGSEHGREGLRACLVSNMFKLRTNLMWYSGWHANAANLAVVRLMQICMHADDASGTAACINAAQRCPPRASARDTVA